MTAWSGRPDQLSRKEAVHELSAPGGEVRSPYYFARSLQGATIVPRTLWFVEPAAASRLSTAAYAFRATKEARWKVRIEGMVEPRFLFFDGARRRSASLPHTEPANLRASRRGGDRSPADARGKRNGGRGRMGPAGGGNLEGPCRGWRYDAHWASGLPAAAQLAGSRGAAHRALQPRRREHFLRVSAGRRTRAALRGRYGDAIISAANPNRRRTT